MALNEYYTSPLELEAEEAAERAEDTGVPDVSTWGGCYRAFRKNVPQDIVLPTVEDDTTSLVQRKELESRSPRDQFMLSAIRMLSLQNLEGLIAAIQDHSVVLSEPQRQAMFSLANHMDLSEQDFEAVMEIICPINRQLPKKTPPRRKYRTPLSQRASVAGKPWAKLMDRIPMNCGAEGYAKTVRSFCSQSDCMPQGVYMVPLYRMSVSRTEVDFDEVQKELEAELAARKEKLKEKGQHEKADKLELKPEDVLAEYNRREQAAQAAYMDALNRENLVGVNGRTYYTKLWQRREVGHVAMFKYEDKLYLGGAYHNEDPVFSVGVTKWEAIRHAFCVEDAWADIVMTRVNGSYKHPGLRDRIMAELSQAEIDAAGFRAAGNDKARDWAVNRLLTLEQELRWCDRPLPPPNFTRGLQAIVNRIKSETIRPLAYDVLEQVLGGEELVESLSIDLDRLTVDDLTEGVNEMMDRSPMMIEQPE